MSPYYCYVLMIQCRQQSYTHWLLILSLLSALGSTAGLQSQTLRTTALSVGSFQVDFDHSPDDPRVYTYPEAGLSSQTRVALGVSKMSWGGRIAGNVLESWGLLLRRDSSNLEIQLIGHSLHNFWKLEICLIFIKEQRFAYSLSQLTFTSESEEESYLMLPISEEKTPRRGSKAQIPLEHRKYQKMLKPFVLLTGVRFNASLQINLELKNYWQNATHLILENRCRGIQQIHYSILVFREYELLMAGLYLDVELVGDRIQKGSPLGGSKIDNLAVYHMRSRGALMVESTGTPLERSLIERITVAKISCSDSFWHFQLKACQQRCLQFQKFGSVMVCLSSKERLLKSAPSLPSPCTCSTSTRCRFNGNWLTQSVACPGSITNCQSCITISGSTTIKCDNCNSGFYITSDGKCQACPTGCSTCSSYSSNGKLVVDCQTCLSTFTLKGQTINYCACKSTQYMTSSSPPSCLSCPTGCSACTSNTVCSGCKAGYTMVGTLCQPCMSVCKTCSSITTCSTCAQDLILSGSTCTCKTGEFIDYAGPSCQPCSHFFPDCLTCIYDPSLPTNVICQVPKPGFFVESDGSTSACGAYCSVCTSNTVCTTCQTNFPDPSYAGGICACVSPNYLAGTSPETCDTCGNIIPDCFSCTNVLNVTYCSTCDDGFYPTVPGQSPTCLPCNPICLTCLDGSSCYTCPAGMYASGNGCLCSAATQYVNLDTLACQSCGAVIFKCTDCTDTYPPTCVTCAAGTYRTTDHLQCLPCPLNCSTCSSSTTCDTCKTGYTLNAGACECGTACQHCLSITGNICSECTSGLSDCTGCAAGYFFDSTSCVQCLLTCQQCTDATTCSSCTSPFTLASNSQCICNQTAGMYLTLDSLTCASCGTVIANCIECQVASPTNCVKCTDGMYYNSVNQQCQNCNYPCATCQNTPDHCLSCVATFSLDATNNFCYCNSPLAFYSSVTQVCESCSFHVANCISCTSSNTWPATTTTCTACADPYFVDSGTNSCLPCDPKCTSCNTVPNQCTFCIGNLIVLPGNTSCTCDTVSDPKLYYSVDAGICVSCLSILDNCQDCTPDPLNCTDCKIGTYFSGNICVNCPQKCATCNSSGCLSCPTGLTLSGMDCVCGSTCTTCQITAPNCLSCTLDSSGVVTACSSCAPGYSISLSGDSCISCPVGCATCSGGACSICLPTFSLSGSICSCSPVTGLYLTPSSDACALCNDIFYGCETCTFDGTSTSCSKCSDGMFLNGTICSYCDPSCSKCSTQTTCTDCPAGYILDGSGNCICGADCSSCSSSTNCTSCLKDRFGAVAQCTACSPGSYLLSTHVCHGCQGNCVTCDSNGDCTSCSVTFEVIGGLCGCDDTKGIFLHNTSNLCVSCESYYSYCSTCVYSTSISFGFNCSQCKVGYYWFNNSCTQQVCGNGVISPSQECDDGNSVSGDGCYLCKIESNYQCTGEPSKCIVHMNFKLSFDSVAMSTSVCNQLIMYFHIQPHYNNYYNVDFNLMYGFHNLPRLEFKGVSTYTPNYVAYKFELKGDVQRARVAILFFPNRLGIQETQDVPMYPVYVAIPESSNSIPIIYQSSDACDIKEAATTYVTAVQYTSYGVMALSALPCKIVGLQLMGVLQLSYLSLGNIDHLNPMLSSLTQLSGTNGAKLKMDEDEPTKNRRLQTSALTPGRVQTIGYSSNFIRNCNLMLLIVMVIILVSFILYAVTYICKKCAPSLFAISNRLLKQVLLTLILFNCFNFAYCAGLHFTYADKDDDLYVLGTIAAVSTIVLPVVMVGLLQLSEDEGFGEFKDKLKAGKLERGYFMLTILYRIGIGYYMATMNEDDLSTLIVLAISLFFLLYNLVNLPFQKAYHNYRANICHITQFICLFVALYYRSMMSEASSSRVDEIYVPVYIQLAAIGLSLLVSLIVLFVEVYLWIKSVREWCSRKEEPVNDTEGDLKQMPKEDEKKFDISIQNL